MSTIGVSAYPSKDRDKVLFRCSFRFADDSLNMLTPKSRQENSMKREWGSLTPQGAEVTRGLFCTDHSEDILGLTPRHKSFVLATTDKGAWVRVFPLAIRLIRNAVADPKLLVCNKPYAEGRDSAMWLQAYVDAANSR